MISVIIPTYNRAHLIRRAVQSVLNQSFTDLEVIVVDDASTDDTQQVVESIPDGRVRYFRLPKNMGACAARNHGVAHALGQYIAFQDSDDEWLPNKLECQMKHLTESHANLVFCAFNRYDADGHFLCTTPPASVTPGPITYEQLLFESLASTQTILAEKACFENVPFTPDFPRLQDWELMLRMVQKYRVVYHNDILVHLYEQPDSISAHPEKALKALKILCSMHRSTIEQSEQLTIRMLVALEAACVKCRQPAWKYYLHGLSAKRSIKTNFYLLARLLWSLRIYIPFRAQ